MNPTMAKPPNVKVVATRLFYSGNTKAFVSVQIGSLTIHDFRIVQQPNQRAYVAAPQTEYLTADNEKRFKPMLSYPDSWKEAIEKRVLAAYDEAIS